MGADHDRVREILGSVRRRWRTRIALRGGATVLGAGLAAFLISAYGLTALHFAPPAVWGLRLASWGAVAAVAWIYLIRPLRMRVSDEQVALYFEEHEPSLQATLLSAVEAAKGGDGSGRATLEDLYRQIQAGQAKELRIILKADVSGSLGAITHALEQLDQDEVRINVLHEAAGDITDGTSPVITRSCCGTPGGGPGAGAFGVTETAGRQPAKAIRPISHIRLPRMAGPTTLIEP